MTDKDKAELKIKLVASLKEMEGKIKDLKELTRPIAPSDAIGRISRMDAINNKSINDAALVTANEKFKKIKIAIGKSDDINFGICLKCKGEIPIGRLMLMPESIKCVRCS